MIAQYQRKFGFTAILVSHEIPDVYFISNRILALYDRKIVFQGTPEELEEFDHPFNDEVIRSLEGFQEELTGLYSWRRFKVLYHGQLKRTGYGEAYSVSIFTLDSPEAIVDKWGYDAEQEVVRRMGGYQQTFRRHRRVFHLVQREPIRHGPSLFGSRRGE